MPAREGFQSHQISRIILSTYWKYDLNLLFKVSAQILLGEADET